MVRVVSDKHLLVSGVKRCDSNGLTRSATNMLEPELTTAAVTPVPAIGVAELAVVAAPEPYCKNTTPPFA